MTKEWRLIIINGVVSFFAGLALSGAGWLWKNTPWILAATIPLSIVLFIILYLNTRLNVFRSGIHRYYPEFPIVLGPKKHWKRIGSIAEPRFDYLGVSAWTILRDFDEFLKSEKSNARYRILLMEPGTAAVQQQKWFQLGIEPDSVSAYDGERVADNVAEHQKHVESTLATLCKSRAWHEQRLSIRFYSEFTPWWIYVVDKAEMVVGLLPFGHENCVKDHREPALILRKKSNESGLFHAFMYNFERIWKNAKEYRPGNP